MNRADPFAALGDTHRRAIIEELVASEKSVQELADTLPISRPAVSRHLKLLKAARLVVDRQEGVRRFYSLDDAGAEDVRRYMAGVWGDAIARYRIAVENLDD